MNKQQEHLLGTEIEFYETNKDEFLHKHTNRHLLIKGRKLVGDFSTMNQAVGEGFRRFGTDPFLVRLSGEDTPTFTVPLLALGLPFQS
ncbi:MAG: hypothetical protein OXB95_03550 [Rhodobacteraceae bacterium]|nr:hypothetical protein [Paracoccaceae bacterium]